MNDRPVSPLAIVLMASAGLLASCSPSPREAFERETGIRLCEAADVSTLETPDNMIGGYSYAFRVRVPEACQPDLTDSLAATAGAHCRAVLQDGTEACGYQNADAASVSVSKERNSVFQFRVWK